MCCKQIIISSPILPLVPACGLRLLSEARWTLDLCVHRLQTGACAELWLHIHAYTDFLCPFTVFRWRHTTQKVKATPARWWSLSQIQTGPAAPVSLSSEEEYYPPVSRWPGVSISPLNSFLFYIGYNLEPRSAFSLSYVNHSWGTLAADLLKKKTIGVNV